MDKLREGLMKILIDAGQAQHMQFRIIDLENQRDHWRQQAQEYNKLVVLLGARLDYLLLHNQ